MKRILCLVLGLVLCAAVAAGCGNGRMPLPENPAVFTQGTHRAENGEEYATIENDGKVFIPYGLVRAAGPMRDLSYAYGDCLGYVKGDENDRIYALSDDPTGGGWIIRYYMNGIMEQPMAYRELNAAGDVPESVEPFEEETE